MSTATAIVAICAICGGFGPAATTVEIAKQMARRDAWLECSDGDWLCSWCREARYFDHTWAPIDIGEVKAAIAKAREEGSCAN